jgi:hypothetical protein
MRDTSITSNFLVKRNSRQNPLPDDTENYVQFPTALFKKTIGDLTSLSEDNICITTNGGANANIMFSMNETKKCKVRIERMKCQVRIERINDTY